MFDFTDINLTPTTGAVAIFTLKQRLKAKGWTVPSSSDGTTYNAAGDQITTGASGAGGMANSSAWFRIRMPGATGREFTFQRGSTNAEWRLKYVHQVGFTGGSPSATQTPSGTSEQIQLGGGTDASPSFGAAFAADGTYRYHAVAGGAEDGYGFYSLGYATGAVSSHCIILDPIANGHPGDQDPYMFVIGDAGHDALSQVNLSDLAGGGGFPNRCWLKPNLGGAGFVFMAALRYHDQAGMVAPTLLPDNPINSAKELLPILYARGSGTAPTGLKGWSTMLRWVAGPLLTKWGTLSVGGGTKNYINGTHVVLPWKGDGTDPLA